MYKNPIFESRSNRALVVTIRRLDNGRTKLVIDNAEQQLRVGAGLGWETKSFCDELEFTAENCENSNQLSEEYSRIGQEIVNSLIALEHR